MHDQAIISNAVQLRWASHSAGSAVQAAFPHNEHFRLRAQALWIVAPCTAHIAALEKYCGAYPRSIVDGKKLNSKYNSLFHISYFRFYF